VARALADRFRATAHVVDVDTTAEAEAMRDVVVIDRERAARLGVTQAAVAGTLRLASDGINATQAMDGGSRSPVPVRLRLPAGDQARWSELLDLRVRGTGGELVPLSAVASVHAVPWDNAIQHKDLLPVVYVTGDVAGGPDSPLYGMFSLVGAIGGEALAGQRVTQHFVAQPPDSATFAIKWDGEWQITYETFRDMGLAYAVGLVLIYLLVVGQFRSYVVPVIVMAPIPLTVIGVLPGHALMQAPFTATSMIGMIALAGIIVRNSILLIDFIDHARAAGQPLVEAVVAAVTVRAKPIFLTAAAAMLGAAFILDDPIFNGLSIALISGMFVSTVLTLVVIPLLYHGWLLRLAARARAE
jgi:multidrug efflux pump subunit AcrB